MTDQAKVTETGGSLLTLPVHDEPGLRLCHFCSGPIPDEEKAVEATTKNAWAHFECWYNGTPFKRDPITGRELALTPPSDGATDQGVKLSLTKRATSTVERRGHRRVKEPAYPNISGPEWIARRFHEVYEKLAPAFGWPTQKEPRVAWDDLPAANKRLMVKTVSQLLHSGVIDHGEESPWWDVRRSVRRPPST